MDPSHPLDSAPLKSSAADASPASREGIAPAIQPPDAMAAPLATAWDAALGAALRDVPVPAGLAERLMARLQDSAGTPAGSTSHVRLAGAGRGRRRWLKATAAGLACAASLAVAVLYLNQPTAELGGESVMELVRAFHKHQPATESLRHDAAPDAYQPGHFVMPGCVLGWFQLNSPLLGRRGVAYELIGPRQNRATLYVVDFAGPRSAPRLLLNATSPSENLLTTDGQTSASWTDGVRLYVLVADGDEQDFRALVRAPRSMA